MRLVATILNSTAGALHKAGPQQVNKKIKVLLKLSNELQKHTLFIKTNQMSSVYQRSGKTGSANLA